MRQMLMAYRLLNGGRIGAHRSQEIAPLFTLQIPASRTLNCKPCVCRSIFNEWRRDKEP